MNTITSNLYDVLLCLSNAVDLVAPEVSNHHQQVACLAFRLAERMGLSQKEQQEILIAGMLHDIGALSIDERLLILEEEPVTVNSHAFRSARLLEEIERFGTIAEAVRYHHVPWEHGNGRRFMGKDVPLASHLLHLADRTCVLIKQREDILNQVPGILSRMRSQAGERFMPEAVDALMELGRMEHIWLALVYKAPLGHIPGISAYRGTELELDDIVDLSKMFSRIIDFRSHFTATHSAGVAKTAEKLGEIAGFSRDECKMLLIAGYLHDLGKLAIRNSLLEKPSALNDREYDIIRSHSFYTYQLLSGVGGFDMISKWAAFHHEKLNGSGYPFHLKGDSIPLGSRIMAVADIFTAITEPRPYRKGMGKEQVVNVLKSMARDGSICPEVVSMVLKNLNLLTDICNTSQQQAGMNYDRFFLDDESEAG
jgi:HD-GYP domain-containing protein (c-di-GMP phosphodiesterase class II)